MSAVLLSERFYNSFENLVYQLERIADVLEKNEPLLITKMDPKDPTDPITITPV